MPRSKRWIITLAVPLGLGPLVLMHVWASPAGPSPASEPLAPSSRPESTNRLIPWFTPTPGPELQRFYCEISVPGPYRLVADGPSDNASTDLSVTHDGQEVTLRFAPDGP